jgi:citrate synthase
VSGADWIGATEAARRLSVKPATLYAYVSRGVLRRRQAPDGRSSLFDPAEVDALARRGRPRRPRNPAELILESALTTFVDEQPFYRGMPALSLARDREFEDVAVLLWTGELPEGGNDPPLRLHPSPPVSAENSGRRESRLIATEASGWQATPDAIAAGVAAQSGLPADTLPLERLQVIVPALAATDQVRLHLDPPAVVTAAQSLIAGMVDCLPDATLSDPTLSDPTLSDATLSDATLPAATPSDMSPAAAPADAAPPGAAFTGAESPDAVLPSRASGRLDWIEGESITARLWPKLSPADPQPAILDVLRASLVLLADHELAASTLAARVAASVRADPYAVVATGLGAVGGALHGGASLGAEVMLAEVHEPGQAPRVIGDRLRRGERIPGLGHFVYRKGDPRGTSLLALLRDAVSAHHPGMSRGTRVLAAADAVLAEAHRRRLPEPNIDFALATLVAATGMIKGAGEAIFAVARTAGWIAHALEEYARRTPLRPRAVYVGPAPARDGALRRPSPDAEPGH